MSAPMRSWIDGFLTDCEQHPALIGHDDPDDSYSPEEVVRAVRWIADQYDTLTARLDAAHNVIRRLARSSTGDIIRADSRGWSPAEAAVIRAATADPTPHPETGTDG